MESQQTPEEDDWEAKWNDLTPEQVLASLPDIPEENVDRELRAVLRAENGFMRNRDKERETNLIPHRSNQRKGVKLKKRTPEEKKAQKALNKKPGPSKLVVQRATMEFFASTLLALKQIQFNTGSRVSKQAILRMAILFFAKVIQLAKPNEGILRKRVVLMKAGGLGEEDEIMELHKIEDILGDEWKALVSEEARNRIKADKMKERRRKGAENCRNYRKKLKEQEQ